MASGCGEGPTLWRKWPLEVRLWRKWPLEVRLWKKWPLANEGQEGVAGFSS